MKEKYKYKEPPNQGIIWLRVIAPVTHQHGDYTFKGFSVGDITWALEEFKGGYDHDGDKIIHPEENKWMMNFDYSCFEEITAEEAKGDCMTIDEMLDDLDKKIAELEERRKFEKEEDIGKFLIMLLCLSTLISLVIF